MKHFLWSLVLVFLAAAPAWSSPNFVPLNKPPSTTGGSVLFLIGDTSDSPAIGVSGFCTVRYQQASGDDAALYAVTTPTTAASSGTLLKTFSGSTSPSNPAYTFTASTQWVKAKATDATAGGSVMVIECNPTFGSSGGGGGSFDACRSGQTQGGGYSSTDGRWAWTCGNYQSWRAYQDPTNASTALYTVDCTGDGTPHLSCLRDAETRYIGYGLNIALAAQYTRDGGKVYLPEGIYVDNGAGLDEAGAATPFPHPYDPEWEARSDFADLGYPTALRVIQLNRGVRLIGEGVPKAVTYDASDTSVSRYTPKLTGTWIVDDMNAADGASTAATLMGSPATIDPTDYYRITVGGNPFTPFCQTTGNSDPTCLTNTTTDNYEQAQDMPTPGRVWGIDFRTNQNFSFASPQICVPDTDWTGLGSDQSDAKGTCSLNRMIRCWDQTGAADVARSSGGCDFGGTKDYGVCEAPYEALQRDYTTNAQDLQIAMGLSECTDDASSATDCATGAVGWDLYITDIRGYPGSALPTNGNCDAGTGATSGTYVKLGNAWQGSHADNADISASIPFPTFYPGGSETNNRIFPIKRGSFDGKNAGFENIGRMPANWLTRDSATNGADCKSGGTIGDSDDEAECDTGTSAGFAMSYNNLVGPNNLFYRQSYATTDSKSSVIETYPSGGPNFFIGNSIDSHMRGTVSDWGDGTFANNTLSNINSSGLASSTYAIFACYSGHCLFQDNVIMNSSVPSVIVTTFSPRRITFARNQYYNLALTDAMYYLYGQKEFFLYDEIISGGYYSPLMRIIPGFQNNQKPRVVVRGLRALMNFPGVASNGTSDGGTPKSFILVSSYKSEDGRTDEYKSILIDDVHVKNLGGSNTCLVWIEDDWDTLTAGPSTADAAALTREDAERITIMNSSIADAGTPAIACTGQYVFSGAVADAATTGAVDWGVEAYAPLLKGNKVNNVAVPDMMNTMSEANVPVANTLPDGTEVRVRDVAAACGHTTGNLNSGSNVLTCVSDQATNAWAAK